MSSKFSVKATYFYPTSATICLLNQCMHFCASTAGASVVLWRTATSRLPWFYPMSTVRSPHFWMGGIPLCKHTFSLFHILWTLACVKRILVSHTQKCPVICFILRLCVALTCPPCSAFSGRQPTLDVFSFLILSSVRSYVSSCVFVLHSHVHDVPLIPHSLDAGLRRCVRHVLVSHTQ